MNKLNYSNSILLMIFCIITAGNSFSINVVNRNARQFTVVIDPGHGGKDPGAVNKNVREKDVVLGVGLKLGKLISENHQDVKVIFTRSTDVSIPLIDRSRIANKSKADLFISIHANICATPSIRGTETFFLGPSRVDDNLDVAKKENSVILLEDDYSTTYEGFDPNSSESYIMFEMAQSAYLKQSLDLAEDIQHQFKSRSDSPNRGVKQAGFLVLRMSSMPSVLIETGFISNATEANSLNSEEGQQHIALSVFEAFKKFKNKYSGTQNTKTSDIIAKTTKTEEIPVKQEPVKDSLKEEKKVNVPVEVITTAKKTEPEKTEAPVVASVGREVSTGTKGTYYSIQIGASATSVEPSAANFKGLNNVRREKDDRYYRYYLGNESKLDNLKSVFNQAKLKFPQAFIVSFVDGKRIPLNILLK